MGEESEIREFFDLGYRLLEIDKVPTPSLTSSDFSEIYSNLERCAMGYKTFEGNRHEYKKDAKRTLDAAEFQASFHVLGITDNMGAMGAKERNVLYLQALYSNPGEFDFFNSRELAIVGLSNSGIIDLIGYQLKH